MRSHRTFSVTIPAGEKTSGPINISQFDAAHFYVEATLAGDYVGYAGAEVLDGTEATVRTPATVEAGTAYDGTEITTEITTNKGNWYAFPPHLFGMHNIKIVTSRKQVGAHNILISGTGPD